jgi:aminopeptidase N
MMASAIVAGVAIAADSSASTEPSAAVDGETPRGCLTGLGDRIQPSLGTPGVQVERYRSEVVFPAGLARFTARTVMTGRVSQPSPLHCVALDFSGNVNSVQMDGLNAAYHKTQQKLYVMPSQAIRPGQSFAVTVDSVTTVPALAEDQAGSPNGVFSYGGVVQMLGQPSMSHDALPMADHPAQKAPWAFTITVPPGLTAVANGVQTGHRSLPDGERFEYRMDQAMPTHVMQLAVGRLKRVDGGSHGGVHIRHYLPVDSGSATTTLLVTAKQLAWLEARLGSFPFAEYGVLATPAGGDLETQTVSTVGIDELQPDGSNQADGVLLHELTHQWFGNSVAVKQWGSDLWLSEGSASFYESLYSADRETFDAGMRNKYEALQKMIDQYGPVAHPKDEGGVRAPFNEVAYIGGALTLYALRAEVGETTFDRIQRAWVQTYRNRSAGTDDYIRLASKVSGRDLSRLLTNWLYGKTVPAMPHHPDWKSAPSTR